jgi:hypothetical protein
MDSEYMEQQINFKVKPRFIERLKAVLDRDSNENASDLIRKAVLREIELRERKGIGR